MAMRKKNKPERQEWKLPAPLQILRGVLGAALTAAKIAIGGVVTVALILVVCCIVVVGAAGDYLENDVIPGITFEAEDFSLDQTSFIYYVDANGEIQEYDKINTSTDRQWATLDEIPDSLIHAAIAIEDQRFYEHQGVDWITTVKACANMFFGGSDTFGGSTITQQLIKNLTGDNSVTVQRKVEEIFRAQKYERANDKDNIMEWYLNTVYFGKLKYGVKSAAMYYFAKDLDELTIAESASLIAITNNPSLYNPYTRPENNRKRQENVLWAMEQQGWITEAEYQEALAQEMVFTKGDESKQTFTCGNDECGFKGEAKDFDRSREDIDPEKYAPGENIYYCPQCTHKNEFVIQKSSDVYSWYTEMVMDDVAHDLCIQNGDEWNADTKKTYLELIKLSGYHIYACIDVEAQAVVDEIYANLDHIPDTKSAQQLLSAIVLIDNRTGDIAAVAGSVGEKTAYDATNHATEDDPKQTGSAMKPVAVYGPAFESGLVSPVTCLPDLPLTYDGGRFPNNVNRKYNVGNSVYSGVVKSNNTISVHTLKEIGLEYAFNFASEKFRIDGLVRKEITESGREISDIGYAPLGLGALTFGVSVEDMANAYATFPNGGVFREARTYTKVYDSDGNLVLDNTQETEQILSEKANNYVNYCLRGVVENNYSVQLSATAAAGKTGTTSDSRDRWFCGYTKYYTAAVWCGYKQPEEIKVTSGGSNPACTMWGKVMKNLHAGKEWKSIYSTSGMNSYSICIDSGGTATDACSADPRGNRVQTVLAYSEDKPTKKCDKHITVDWCVSGEGAANEYCKLAGCEIVKRGLVKYTQKEYDNIKKAGNVTDFDESVVYLMDGDKGAPMKKCTAHTAASILPPEPEPTEPAPTPAPEGGANAEATP